MTNMGYCRFQNTLGDLEDCEQAEGLYDPDLLSEDERRARKQLIELCRSIAAEFDGEAV